MSKITPVSRTEIKRSIIREIGRHGFSISALLDIENAVDRQLTKARNAEIRKRIDAVRVGDTITFVVWSGNSGRDRHIPVKVLEIRRDEFLVEFPSKTDSYGERQHCDPAWTTKTGLVNRHEVRA